MASSPTELYLPPTFPYPIKIVSLDARVSSSVRRSTRLLGYSFVHISNSPDVQPETRFGTWDSAIEGTLEKWNIKVGDVISLRKSKETPVVVIVEPCKHGMQLGGLCVLCGRDMTNIDYTGFSDSSRASIQMTHSAFGPTVSLEEAQRIERETAESLLKSRKLSLIVDLDQTIVHATVDPTVNEWITEGEEWEARRAGKASSNKQPSETDDTSLESDDECNPNWEALKDVKKFRLGPESFGPPPRGPHGVKGKNKLIENEGCMYYIKPRPGWREFLQEMAKKYEMHVYTMGTRAYAEEVCSAIDPDSSIFGGRLLSRDESGSLTQKSLQRLFPCDTSMVVIIDDRADVWEWSPNLIKVIPYDFFIGIGDINSSFLPKLEPLSPIIPLSAPSGTNAKDPANPSDTKDVHSQESPDASTNTPPTPTPLVIHEPAAIPENDTVDLTKSQMVTQNNLALEAQLEERPLAKKQEALSEGAASSEHQQKDDQQSTTESQIPATSGSPKPERKALLKNDDFELERVSKLLTEVHGRFFYSYDTYQGREPGGKSHEKPHYDVTKIIPQIRMEVLKGVHILFSSVIPLDTRPESTEIWKMAHMFGAKCSTELKSEITHVVAAKRGTVKVDMARKRGGIKIVWLSWFTDSIALWKRQDETTYLLDEPPAVGPSSSPTADSQQISSDIEPDTDDWDEEVTDNRKDTGSLELDSINWNAINDEVDAFLNETDDEDDESGVKSGMASDDEDMISDKSISNSNTPTTGRKRLRSVTPSDNGSMNGTAKDDSLRSPLAKRKKLAADRTGSSRLKQGITADELLTSIKRSPDKGGGGEDGRTVPGSLVAFNLPIKEEEEEESSDEDEGDDDSEDEEDEEDDFLTRDFEDELG